MNRSARRYFISLQAFFNVEKSSICFTDISLKKDFSTELLYFSLRHQPFLIKKESYEIFFLIRFLRLHVQLDSTLLLLFARGVLLFLIIITLKVLSSVWCTWLAMPLWWNVTLMSYFIYVGPGKYQLFFGTIVLYLRPHSVLGFVHRFCAVVFINFFVWSTLNVYWKLYSLLMWYNSLIYGYTLLSSLNTILIFCT